MEDNLIIIDTPDATFIATHDKAQEVKSIVESLQASGRCESSAHRKVYRPWGWYDSIESCEHFQVKRLHIKPSAKLSLQMHHKRPEHWIVARQPLLMASRHSALKKVNLPISH